MYKIIGIYKGNKEVLEEQVETKQEANFLVQEYQMSFGNEWIIYKN
tara:strand:- start:773 stop:910 length:138 start_codon:yes stop_codon:yes gene_type:complete